MSPADEKIYTESGINTSNTTQFARSTELILASDHASSAARNSREKSLQQKAYSENCCSQAAKNIFRKKTLLKRLPILTWLPKYSRADAVGDLIAGVTVGLTVIPQGLAYSSVAGLPTQYGLYGSFMGCFVYVFLGTCKDSTVGSTAVASLLVFQMAKGVWQRAVLLTFLTGFIEILMAIFRLSFLVDFASAPVTSGYTSAVALIIFTSQMRNLLGVKTSGSSFVQMWISIIGNIRDTHIPDALLGATCITFLIFFRFIGSLRFGCRDDKEINFCQRMVNKFLWFLGVSRNAIIVVVCTALAWYLEPAGKNLFHLTGYIPPGLPELRMPPLFIPEMPGNNTIGVVDQAGESLLEMISNLGSGLVVVPLVALLENISVCKAFAKGKPIDATQELYAMGVANIANSFFQGYRANGGLARSAVNNASGVRTPLANLYIGGVVVLALMYVSEYFSYIPKATLASVIISAVIFTLQYHVIVPVWKSKKTDLIPGFAAFFACLALPLQYGILIAIGINMMFILYHSARPKVSLETIATSTGIGFIKITPDRCLFFPSIDFVRNLIFKAGVKEATLPVVIDCTYVYGADYTAAKAVTSIIDDFSQRQQKIIFYNLKPSVVHVFEGLDTKLVLCYNYVDLEHELGNVNAEISVSTSLEMMDNNDTHGSNMTIKTKINDLSKTPLA